MTRTLFLSSCLLLLACPAPTTCDGGDCEPTDAATPTTCDAGTFRAAEGDCRAVGVTSCGAGLKPDPTGWGCTSALAACDAGAIAVPGAAGCVAVGWTECPAGFTHDGWTCQPTLPTTACTGATRASLGESSCTPIGDCAAPFPPAAATLFVDASLDGGDATHFSSLAAALTAAPAGATIAVAPGTYREALVPPRAVKLIGRCAAQVELIGSPALFADGVSGVELEGFTVRDSLLAVRVERGGGVTVRHAVLESNQRSAVQAVDTGSRVTLEDVVVRDTRPDPGTQTFGQGVAASFGAQLTLTDVELSGNRETALFLDRAMTSATVSRTVISNTLPRASTGRLGWGVGVQRGAALMASSLVIQDSRTSGLVVTAAPSAVTLTDTLVRRTALGLDNAGQSSAVSVAVLQGATLTWTRGGLEGSPGELLHAQDPGSTATLHHVSARDVVATTGVPTSALTASDSARVTLDHVSVRESDGSALFANGSAELTVSQLGLFDVSVGLRAQHGRITGTDVEVRGHADSAALALEQGTLSLTRCALADATGSTGFGASVGVGGLLTLEQCVLSDNASAGVYANGAGATALVTGGVIERTQLSSTGEFGQGAVAEGGGAVHLTDVTVARNHTAGIQVADATSTLEATRVTVRATQPNATGTRGRGANANFGGAVMKLSSVAVVDNQQVGLFAFQARLEATDSAVVGMRSDPDGAYGNAVEALTDGVIVFTRGALEGSSGIAAVFAEGAGVLDGVRVAKNAIGLHAQDGSTIEELASAPATLGARQVVVTSSTRFEENVAKLSATTVPVPPP